MGTTTADMIPVRVVLHLGRVSNVPTVWSNVMAGAVLSGSPIRFSSLLSLQLSLSLMYLAGMFLNDAFDHAIDAIERPQRPIPAGQVTVQMVFVIGFALLIGAVLLLAWLGTAALYSGIVLALTVVLYNLYHKRNPISPLVMGACRSGVYITSALALSRGVPAQSVWWGALALFAYSVSLTYTAKQENGGEKHAILPWIGLAVSFLYAVLSMSLNQWVWGYLGVFILWGAYCLRMAMSSQQYSRRRATEGLIAGIALQDALLMAIYNASVWAATGCVAFALTLVFQRRVEGT